MTTQYLTLLYSFVHSFIIDVDDNEVKTHFIKDELYEIKSASKPDVQYSERSHWSHDTDRFYCKFLNSNNLTITASNSIKIFLFKS